jgi:putative hemolysin
MLITELAVVLALIIVNGVLAMSELAIVSSRQMRLKAMVARGVHGSRRALALHSDPGRFLSTVQIGITLVGILAGAFSGATIAARLSGWLMQQGLSQGVAEPLGFGLVVTFITYLSLVIGELVPKQVALRHPERIACAMAPAMTVLARIASPLVWVLDRSGRLLLALLRQRAASEGKVTDEEIKTLVAEAESAGVLEPAERAMIAGVMRLGDRPVQAVMTPRPDVDYVDLAEDLDAIKRRIAGSMHSRLPACEGSLDNILGIIQAKDLLNACIEGGDLVPRAFLRSAPIIPDTTDALDVVAVLKNSPVHLGLVYDEYGNFEGVVTSADILEAIAGEFRTEEGPVQPDVVKRQDGSYLVEGSTPVDELADLLGLELPDDRSYHTVAGLLLAAFGRLPQVSEAVDAYGWRFEVVDLDGRRIDKILVSKVPPRRRAA